MHVTSSLKNATYWNLSIFPRRQSRRQSRLAARQIHCKVTRPPRDGVCGALSIRCRETSVFLNSRPCHLPCHRSCRRPCCHDRGSAKANDHQRRTKRSSVNSTFPNVQFHETKKSSAFDVSSAFDASNTSRRQPNAFRREVSAASSMSPRKPLRYAPITYCDASALVRMQNKPSFTSTRQPRRSARSVKGWRLGK